jgi:copper(I)-binding protein
MTFVKAACAATVTLLILAASVSAGDKVDDHGDNMAEMKMVEHKVGDLTLTGAFARATLPNQPVAGGFLRITNTGDMDDRLVSVSASFAQKGEVHEMAMDGDTMRMRKLSDGLVIPAGETVELQPGGYHLMFMKLNTPLVEGEMVDATLLFENAGTVTIPLAVLGKGAKSMDHSEHGS